MSPRYGTIDRTPPISCTTVSPFDALYTASTSTTGEFEEVLQVFPTNHLYLLLRTVNSDIPRLVSSGSVDPKKPPFHADTIRALVDSGLNGASNCISLSEFKRRLNATGDRRFIDGIGGTLKDIEDRCAGQGPTRDDEMRWKAHMGKVESERP